MVIREVSGRDDRFNREMIHRRALKKATNIIAVDRVDMYEFADVYTPDQIRKDKKKVTDLEAHFAQDRNPEGQRVKELATIFEAILLEQIDQSMWFGKEVETRAASTYDDYINGVDVIAMVNIEDKALAVTGLAMDATYANYPYQKIDKILKSIRERKASQIRYFEGGDFKGTLTQIPRVVLTVDIANLEELADIWVQDKKGLEKHPIIAQIADQIFIQLEAYYVYAKKHLQANDPLIAMYERQYAIWTGVFQQLEDSGVFDEIDAHEASSRFGDNDPRHLNLVNYIRELN